MRPYKQLLAIIFLIIILSSNYAIFAQETPENITIEFDTETYGQVSQSLGVIVPNSLSPQTVGEIKSTFPNGTIYLKLVNPTTSTVNSSGFQELYQAGFKWYFLFTNANNAFGVVDAYTGLYSPERLVIEVEKDDTAFITDLKGSYSAVRIHAGHLPVWPRSQVNEILSQVQPPTIEGISFWLGLIDEGAGVFRDVEFAFDTLFDAKSSREFSIWYEYRGENLPWFVREWEEKYIAASKMDKMIWLLARHLEHCDRVYHSIPHHQTSQILTIPFEHFVLDPWPYMKQIEKLLGVHMTRRTYKEMKRQKVPRKMIAEGIDLPIYRKYGWEPPKTLTEIEEMNRRREFVAKEASHQAMETLDRLCQEYERQYLS